LVTAVCPEFPGSHPLSEAHVEECHVAVVALQERTKNAQFIIISLRNNMFELADRLVGIYKTANATKTVTINPHRMVAVQPTRPLQDRTNTSASAQDSPMRLEPAEA
jgi:hypothetical protein